MRRASFDAQVAAVALTGDIFNGNIYAVGSDGVSARVTETALTGASIASTTASLAGPAAMDFDAATGSLYVANATNGTVNVYDAGLAGTTAAFAPPPGLSQPTTLTIVY